MKKHDYGNVPDADRITDTQRFAELREVLMNMKKPSEYFENLKADGEVKKKYPELYNLTGVKQNQKYHQEGDVWTHTMLVTDKAAAMREKTAFPLGFMLSALCHDLGKAVTTEEKDGAIHAYGHESAGVPIAEKFLRSFSEDERLNGYVLNMVRLHMEPNVIAGAGAKLKSSNRMFERSCEPYDLICLALCDGAGKIPPDSGNEEFLMKRLDMYNEIMSRSYVTEKDITDNNIADESILPEVLEHARKLRLAGTDREKALIQLRGFARKLREEKQRG